MNIVMREKYLGWLGAFVGLVLFVAMSQPLLAQTYQPGTTYFGRSNYIEYIAGDLPFILSAPHGGALQPAELAMRRCPCSSTRSSRGGGRGSY